MKNISRNLTMLCDFYELTMGNGYLRAGIGERITYFDLFFREVPDGGGFAIAAGLEQVVEYINDRTREAALEGKRVGVIGTDATKSLYDAEIVKSVGSRDDEKTIAHELFKVLREFDDENIDVMYSESFDDSGIGQAIMNRLLKAAGHHVITL